MDVPGKKIAIVWLEMRCDQIAATDYSDPGIIAVSGQELVAVIEEARERQDIVFKDDPFFLMIEEPVDGI